MAGGILRRAIGCEAQDIDVERRVAEPVAQALGEGFAGPFTEFSDDLGNAAGCEMLRQAFDDAFLNIFARGPAVAVACAAGRACRPVKICLENAVGPAVGPTRLTTAGNRLPRR